MAHRACKICIYGRSFYLMQNRIIFLIACIIITSILCQERNNNDITSNQFLNLDDTIQYVGIDKCKMCHYDKYQSFINTGMGKSFNKAVQKNSSLALNEDSVLFDKYTNLFYSPFWKDSSLFIKEYQLTGNDTTHLRIEQVNYIIGSGHHTNSHLYEINNYLFQMPFTFYTQHQKLDFPPGFENGNNTRFSRQIGLECISCHNAYPNITIGSENKFSNLLNGIDCERCHGPGELHVKEKLLGNIIDTANEIDYTIVNPAHLSNELQFQICQRCHLQGNAVLKEGKSFFDFKPGMMLNDVIDVYLPKYTHSEGDFLMASHVERFKMSNCYTASNKKFVCTSCHDPHVSVNELSNIHFNKKCQSCHTKNNFCNFKQEELIREDFNCVKCHMQKSSSIDIPHVTITDHYIKPPITKNKSSKIKEFVELLCINNPNPNSTSKAIAYLQQFEKFTKNNVFLDSALYYIEKINDVNKAHLKIHYYYLKNQFKELVDFALINHVKEKFNQVSYSNKDAWSLFRIGDAFFNLNLFPQSKTYLKKSVNLSPYNLDFQNKLGTIYIKLGELKEAEKVLKFIIKENPNFKQAYCNLGIIKSMKKEYEKSIALYEKAIDLDPNYTLAIDNKKQAIFNLNEEKN